ncbi:bacteriohopanetetrol glucosamine biosynthesis glycosyltransferase HpnI [Entomobacter blattae]|uniref:Glycosyl transferase family 21 n=1 Tax=Entomobacter blattae TaxID=2762277 RepID=A0A7H1NPZ4_9PROT|nr:bacteriohopanetetrol glucosamine biosynthesis glycosyltransferase HpnI [Entomobacter blattae]QNT77854.1 Glycosyl transferase family 21 [Entomobacter blattae]
MSIDRQLTSKIALLCQMATLIGLAQGAAGYHFLKKTFKSKTSPSSSHSFAPTLWSGISILKPMHGLEPMLKEALTCFFRLNYPKFELIFGFQNPKDPAIALVEALQKEYPHVSSRIIIGQYDNSVNRKIANLANMLPAAQHNYYVFSDSDIHVRPDYLNHIAQTLQRPQVGVVTTLYGGYPASSTRVREFGAAAINHIFLPGVALSRALGREDCLGATIALHKQTLHQIGGIESLRQHVADDALIGKKILALGLHIAVAPTPTWTTVGEKKWRDLFSHELRWGRTIRSIFPAGFAASVLQMPLFWASLAVLLQPKKAKSWLFFLAAYGLRYKVNQKINSLFAIPERHAVVHTLLRDVFSVGNVIISFCGTKVSWRGQTVTINNDKRVFRDLKHRKSGN